MVEVSKLTGKVKELVEDLEAQIQADSDLEARLTSAWEEASEKGRTGATAVEWREEYLTQIAVGWVLTALFVRYLEDNDLIDAVIVGQKAQDKQRAYFQTHKEHSDTDYLLSLFDDLAADGHPAGELFGPRRNPLFKLRISGDAARSLLAFFRLIDADTGNLAFDFTGMDTRFLGDVYQDLSEDVRKKYALLQTPDFVEEYILDYTLEPAIATFGLDEVRFIDPTCGSGHFLLGGFKRILDRKRAERPGERIDVLVRESLAATHGVDINPFAVSIARFRLAVEAMQICGYDAFDKLPDLPLNVACGDSLLLGILFDRFERDTSNNKRQLDLDKHRWNDDLSIEDNDIIFGENGEGGILTQQYHAVVGNPPYITVKDAEVSSSYRNYYSSCYRSYALVCPFYERFFDLAIGDDSKQNEQMTLGGNSSEASQQAGYVGMIVANSFMKRQFGSKLIEELIPHTDLTHVIDTSGAYIPGHGTPTVILVGRNREPQDDLLRTVLGIRGEPKTPAVPKDGKVWKSIVEHTDEIGFENDFISVTDSDRTLFHQHPWSLQGGGALECKAHLDQNTPHGVPLDNLISDIGFGAVTREDDVYLVGDRVCLRHGIQEKRPLTAGENLRNWNNENPVMAIWPYDEDSLASKPSEVVKSFLWPFRTNLSDRVAYGKSQLERGLHWSEYSMFFDNRFRTPLTIAFAFVATHNHFVLDRGGKVFKQSAPVIKLAEDATEQDHLSLMSALNSSTACFYMKQIFHDKGNGGYGGGIAADTWERFFEYDCTKMKLVPIPDSRPTELAEQVDALAQKLSANEPSSLASESTPTPDKLEEAKVEQERVFEEMVALQEELDWRCYVSYGLLEEDEAPVVPDDKLDDLPQVRLGERAFEIKMAKKVEDGDLVTSWFERHGSQPTTEIPERYPDWYKEIVKKRLKLMEERQFIRLIEQPEYKRRWNRDDWEEREKSALVSWLCDRLETPRYVPQADREDDFAAENPKVISIQELADTAGRDEDFMQVATRYTGDASFDVYKLVESLVLQESVPFLPTQRYKKSGLSRRKAWEKVWELQRLEDAIDARTELPEDHEDYLSQAEAKALKAREVGDIPKPPKYRSSDFQSGPTWTHRGKLDVPKERFVLLEDCHTEEGQKVVLWAGLDHKQRAFAMLSYYTEEALTAGWDNDRKATLLAGMLDLLPWVNQWHNDLDPRMNARLGDFLSQFIDDQARDLDLGTDAIEKIRIGS